MDGRARTDKNHTQEEHEKPPSTMATSPSVALESPALFPLFLPASPLRPSSAHPSPFHRPRHGRGSPVRCQYRKGWNPDPDVDTRIHWDSPDEGWIGGASVSDASSSSSSTSSALDGIVSDLISLASDSHYEFLGVPTDADGETIKAAYRKLSKLYHPDTTALPLEVAATKFLRLQKAYDVLSSVEERRFYDWNLAQEVSRQQGGGFVWPYEVDRSQRAQGPRTRFATKSSGTDDEYIEFTGQIWAALFFDAFALLVAILSIIFVAFFKH